MDNPTDVALLESLISRSNRLIVFEVEDKGIYPRGEIEKYESRVNIICTTNFI